MMTHQQIIAQSTIAELAAEYNTQASYLVQIPRWHPASRLDRATVQGTLIGLKQAMTIVAKQSNLKLIL